MIDNTTKRDGMIHLLGAMSEGSDDYITGMEAEGQRQLVNSTDLPSEMNHGRDQELLDLGFTLGEPHEHDPLFRPATLPAGWRKEGSDHNMWSYIVDEKGRRRVSVFYKAAFYDRKAFINIVDPTEALGNLYYADDEPTSVPIDELLTAEMAREWIANRRAHDIEYRDIFAKREGDEGTVARYDAHLARLDLLLSLLPSDA